MRCSTSVIVAARLGNLPSEMPSLAFRMATLMPLIWAFMRSAMAAGGIVSGVDDPQAGDRRCIEGGQRALVDGQVCAAHSTMQRWC